MKKEKKEKPKASIMYLAFIAFAILNRIGLETDMLIFNYLSVIPGLFILVAALVYLIDF